MIKTRRQTLAALASIPATLVVPASQTLAATPNILTAPPGGPDPTQAQVFGTAGTPDIEEFFAWTCPHCAHFYLDTFPEIRSQLIDTKKIRWFATPVVTDQPSMIVALIARAISQDQLTAFTQAMFVQQNSWISAKKPIAAVIAIAQSAGIPSGIITNATKDETAREIIMEQTYRAADIPIRGTPSFYMKGKIVEGDISLAHLSYEYGLDRLDAAPGPTPSPPPDIIPAHPITPA